MATFPDFTSVLLGARIDGSVSFASPVDLVAVDPLSQPIKAAAAIKTPQVNALLMTSSRKKFILNIKL